MRQFLLGLSMLLLAACGSPEQRWHRLQRDFLREFPRPAVFLVVLERDTVALPLPPATADRATMQNVATRMLERAGSLNVHELPIAEQSRFTRFKIFLDSLARPDRPVAADPLRYCVHTTLGHFLANDNWAAHPALFTQVVEQLPAYYAAVQQNWVAPDFPKTAAAVEHSAAALDQLDQAAAALPAISAPYRDRLATALPPARLAVKDFIGRCQSAALE